MVFSKPVGTAWACTIDHFLVGIPFSTLLTSECNVGFWTVSTFPEECIEYDRRLSESYLIEPVGRMGSIFREKRGERIAMLRFLYFYLLFVCIRRSVIYRTLVFHRIGSFVPIISSEKEGREMKYASIKSIGSFNFLAHISSSSSCSPFQDRSYASFLFSFPFHRRV